MTSLYDYCKENNLEHLLQEWDYDKNGDLTPQKVTHGCNKKVYWKCSKCKYEWQAKISNRAILNRGCPCCMNKKVVIGINDLATTHPDIAKEWHPTENGDLTPQKVTHGCGKKVWWLCPEGHSYQATVLHRTQENGTNCPICNSGRQTSFAEQAVYYYVKKLYPDAINRYTSDFLGKFELDIYIPSIRCAIEYDGEAWHKKDKFLREQRKYILCKNNGIKLIRLREKQSEPFSENCDLEISRKNLYKNRVLEPTVNFLLEKLTFFNKTSFKPIMYDINLERDKQKILQYKNPLKNNSLMDKYPLIAKEWHPTKNESLTPYMFTPGSDHKVWWLCPTCGYEYLANIGHRTSYKNPTGCPICGIEKSTQAKRKAVNMIDCDTNKVIQTFLSISDASRKLHINGSNITSVCKGQRTRAGGYKWEYVDKN